MNLELINTAAIQTAVPRQNINLYVYDSQSVDDAGIITITYNNPVSTNAQVHLENYQNLMHLNAINATQVFKRFYIQSNTLTGLNRSLQSGGDYIEMVSNGFYYKIIEVREGYQVGWVNVIGAESPSITIGLNKKLNKFVLFGGH